MKEISPQSLLDQEYESSNLVLSYKTIQEIITQENLNKFQLNANSSDRFSSYLRDIQDFWTNKAPANGFTKINIQDSLEGASIHLNQLFADNPDILDIIATINEKFYPSIANTSGQELIYLMKEFVGFISNINDYIINLEKITEELKDIEIHLQFGLLSENLEKEKLDKLSSIRDLNEKISTALVTFPGSNSSQVNAFECFAGSINRIRDAKRILNKKTFHEDLFYEFVSNDSQEIIDFKNEIDVHYFELVKSLISNQFFLDYFIRNQDPFIFQHKALDFLLNCQKTFQTTFQKRFSCYEEEIEKIVSTSDLQSLDEESLKLIKIINQEGEITDQVRFAILYPKLIKFLEAFKNENDVSILPKELFEDKESADNVMSLESRFPYELARKSFAKILQEKLIESNPDVYLSSSEQISRDPLYLVAKLDIITDKQLDPNKIDNLLDLLCPPDDDINRNNKIIAGLLVLNILLRNFKNPDIFYSSVLLDKLHDRVQRQQNPQMPDDQIVARKMGDKIVYLEQLKSLKLFTGFEQNIDFLQGQIIGLEAYYMEIQDQTWSNIDLFNFYKRLYISSPDESAQNSEIIFNFATKCNKFNMFNLTKTNQDILFSPFEYAIYSRNFNVYKKIKDAVLKHATPEEALNFFCNDAYMEAIMNYADFDVAIDFVKTQDEIKSKIALKISSSQELQDESMDSEQEFIKLKTVDLQYFYNKPIMEACKSGRLDVFKFLIEQNPRLIIESDVFDDMSLHIAIKMGKEDIIKYLIEKYSSPELKTIRESMEMESQLNCSNTENQTPISLALQSNNIKVLEAVFGKDLSNIIFLNPNQEKLQSLMFESIIEATNSGSNLTTLKVLSWLIESQKDLNEIQISSLKTLYKDIFKKYIEYSHLEINENTNELKISEDIEECGFEIIKMLKFLKVEEEFISQSFVHDPNIKGLYNFENYLDETSVYSEKYKSTEMPTLFAKCSLLHFCAKFNLLNLAKFCIENGHSIESELDLVSDNQFLKLTPLMIATMYGSDSVIEYLSNIGAEINKTNEAGDTILYICTCEDRKDIMKILIKNGAKVNLESKPCLNEAIQNCNVEIVDILLEAGANPFYRGSEDIDIFNTISKFKKHYLNSLSKIKDPDWTHFYQPKKSLKEAKEKFDEKIQSNQRAKENFNEKIQLIEQIEEKIYQHICDKYTNFLEEGNHDLSDFKDHSKKNFSKSSIDFLVDDPKAKSSLSSGLIASNHRDFRFNKKMLEKFLQIAYMKNNFLAIDSVVDEMGSEAISFSTIKQIFDQINPDATLGKMIIDQNSQDFQKERKVKINLLERLNYLKLEEPQGDVEKELSEHKIFKEEIMKKIHELQNCSLPKSIPAKRTNLIVDDSQVLSKRSRFG